VDAHESALYLSWTLKLYGAALDPELVTSAEAALSSYVTANTVPEKNEEIFLKNVARYLSDGSDKDDILLLLRQSGDYGWNGDAGEGIETNPARLAKVVTALSALFDAAPDAEVRKLAEMNLDVLFTRFAASSVKGAWNSPTAGNTLATADTTRSPWYGWSHLVLGDAEKGSTTEPSMLVSNYCAHGITRVLPSEVRRVLDDGDGDALVTVATTNYSLSAARDGSSTFNPSDGYVTKAKLRFGDYKKFIELNSRTCPEPEDQEDEDAETFLMDNNVVLGRLDPATAVCGEPHALFGVGLEASYILVDNVPHGVVVKSGSEFAILRFLGPVQVAHITERYAERSNYLPTWMLENGAGFVMYPTGIGADSGVFSLEVAPLDFVSEVLNECYDSEVDCIAASAAGNTSLEYSGGEITYTSRTSGQNVVYEYELGAGASINSAAVTTSNHGLRSVLDLTSDWAWFEKTGSTWILQGQYPLGAGQGNAIITLDFTAETV
ncbi:hypothetical protein GOV07_05780, partial [Candidatus Woesearchaeota archaeon]|nr:hypothetical protein [Candidatus Woesearchaeota archaeon]